MSPRSAELFAAARKALVSAQILLEAGQPEKAAAMGYFAMFEAARAALSERDQYARTHRGVLHLLRESFVLREGFPKELHRAAQTAREQREDAHYGAAGAGAPEAAETVDAAERFLAEVERRVGGS